MKCLRSAEGIFNLTISNSSADFAVLYASLFQFYTNMAWNPADVDYFILIGSIIIIVQ